MWTAARCRFTASRHKVSSIRERQQLFDGQDEQISTQITDKFRVGAQVYPANMKGLAGRTESIKASLQATKEQSSKDMRDQLSTVQSNSARQRWLALAVFGVTLALAAVIVNLTIRRTITGPILHVIQGVQEAAEQAGEASNRMAESGRGGGPVDAIGDRHCKQGEPGHERSADIHERDF